MYRSALSVACAMGSFAAATASAQTVLITDNITTPDFTFIPAPDEFSDPTPVEGFGIDAATRQAGTIVDNEGAIGMTVNNLANGSGTQVSTASVSGGMLQIESSTRPQGPRFSFPATPGAIAGFRDFTGDAAGQKYSLSADMSASSLLGPVADGGTNNARALITWGYRVNTATEATVAGAFAAVTLRLRLLEDGVWDLTATGQATDLEGVNTINLTADEGFGLNGMVDDASVLNNFELIIDETIPDNPATPTTDAAFEIKVNGVTESMGTFNYQPIQRIVEDPITLEQTIVPIDDVEKRFLGFEAGHQNGGGDVLDAWVVNFDNPTVTLLPTDSGGDPVEGDYNGNGTVDAQDYAVWRDTLGSTTDLRADGVPNSLIDVADLSFWKSQYGATGASAPVSAAPEPVAGSLVVCLLMGVTGTRARCASDRL